MADGQNDGEAPSSPQGRAHVKPMGKGERLSMFKIGESYWLVGTATRMTMRVTVVDIKQNYSGDWTYKLNDNKDQLVEEGKYFDEDDLSKTED